MARPKFRVHHFIACRNVPWEGTPGPITPRTLETVTSVYSVSPGAEAPFTFPEFWLYARLYRTNQGEGRRSFSVVVV